MWWLTLLACSEYAFNPELDFEDAPAPESGLPIAPDLPTATEAVYVSSATTLAVWDPETATVRPIGTYDDDSGWVICDMLDIAIDQRGHLYGVCGWDLVQIDPTTARFTYVAELDELYAGLTFLADGRLVLGGAEVVKVWEPSSGELLPLYDRGRYATSGDLVGLPDGYLYWSVVGGDDLVRLNPRNGNARRVGSIGDDPGTELVWGLGYAEGLLYGFTSAGDVLEIDPRNADSVVVDANVDAWFGATTNPVRW